MPPKRKAAARDASEEPEEEEAEASESEEASDSDDDAPPKKRAKAAAKKGAAAGGAKRRGGAVKSEGDGAGAAKAAPKGKAARKSGGGGGAGGAGVQPEPAADPAGDPDKEKLAEQFEEEVAKLAEHAHVKSVGAKELERLVADVMRVMLFRRHKDGAPVPRADLTAMVTKAYKDKRQLGPHVVALAQRRFLRTLGMEMQALEKVKRSEADVKKMVAAAGGDKSGGVSYVLRSALPAHLRAAYVDRPEDAPMRGLTMTVLSLVAIAGDGGLPEDALWTQLASLGAPKGSKAHPALGDADAAVEALIKQRYVQRSKAQGPDGERKVLELAENATGEVGMKRISAFIAETMKARGGAAAAADDDDD